MPYDAAFHPPAPILDVVIKNPYALTGDYRCRAVLDTGAGISVIPQEAQVALRIVETQKIAVRVGTELTVRRSPALPGSNLEEELLRSLRWLWLIDRLPCLAATFSTCSASSWTAPRSRWKFSKRKIVN